MKSKQLLAYVEILSRRQSLYFFLEIRTLEFKFYHFSLKRFGNQPEVPSNSLEVDIYLYAFLGNTCCQFWKQLVLSSASYRTSNLYEDSSWKESQFKQPSFSHALRLHVGIFDCLRIRCMLFLTLNCNLNYI